MENVQLCLDYVATHPDTILIFKKTSIVLAVHSDASYLTESKARTREGIYFFMSYNLPNPENNAAVMSIAQIMKHVVSLVLDVEI